MDTDLRSWQKVIANPLPGRLEKPRTKGLTMVIDKGLGLEATRDLLDLGADYIDFLKLGFGTSAFYKESLLREKIRLAKEKQVEIYPGGTFLEVAVFQNRLDSYLERAKELGYTAIEVSDGTIPMTQETRVDAISKALALGFKVITEVGRKDPRDKISNSQLIDEIKADLAYGAFKVIVEGRETGKGIGMFDKKGDIIWDELEEILSGLPDYDVVMWEAPLKNQQVELIQQFGPNVNLGNIQAGDILALEALRVGLRADTFKSCLELAEKVVPLFQKGNKSIV